MNLVRPAKIPRKKRTKIVYQIDEITYESKCLYEFHLECSEAVKKGFITSFEIPKTLAKKSRYTTYKPIIDDIQFDSMMEARYYIKLKKDLKNGAILSFERQIDFELQPKFKKNGKTYRGIDYVCDFLVTLNKDNQKEVIDVKGKETVEFKIKHKLFEYKYPEYNLKVIQFYEPTQEWLDLDQIKKIIRNNKKKKN